MIASVIVDGRKRCPACKQDVPIEDFPRSKNTATGLYPYCKPCSRKSKSESNRRVSERDPSYGERWATYRRTYRAKHPDKVKEGYRKQKLRRFGLTPQEYDEMAAIQKNLCAVCRQEDTKALAVDHDHLTGQVRGLLCGRCNTALGLMNDDADRLRLAANYLEGSCC